MSGDLEPAARLSDADRERAVARLNAAVGEGRISLTEFEERVDGVLRAGIGAELMPYVADLPADTVGAPADEVELRANAGSLKRSGRWAVPRRLVVRAKGGSTKLDMRHAVFGGRTVEISLSTAGGSTTIVLPPGATANVDGVKTSGGSAHIRVPAVPEPGSTAPHVVVTGSAAGGSLTVRYEWRFWRWTF